jgi:hypothetical protein
LVEDLVELDYAFAEARTFAQKVLGQRTGMAAALVDSLGIVVAVQLVRDAVQIVAWHLEQLAGCTAP